MIPAEVLASVRRIEIKTKSIIDSLMGGEYRTAFKGNGMEFAEVRHYEEGDDIRSIDWNGTFKYKVVCLTSYSDTTKVPINKLLYLF